MRSPCEIELVFVLWGDFVNFSFPWTFERDLKRDHAYQRKNRIVTAG